MLLLLLLYGLVSMGPRIGHCTSVTPEHETVDSMSARFQRIPLPACLSSSSWSVSHSLRETAIYSYSLLLAEIEILHAGMEHSFLQHYGKATLVILTPTDRILTEIENNFC